MDKKILKNMLLCFSCAVFAGTAIAQGPARYVSDNLVITLRTGPGAQYKIIQTLKSGTRLEMLEEQNEFTHVRLDADTEGWVRKQYLQNSPTAALILQGTTAKFERATAENKRLKDELDQLKNEHSTLMNRASELEEDNNRLQKENARVNLLAKRPLELDAENKQLREESAKISEESSFLKSENETLKASTSQKWFMAGSGVLLFGVLMGILLPRLRARRQSGDWA